MHIYILLRRYPTSLTFDKIIVSALRIRWQIAPKENAGESIYYFGTRIIQNEGLFKG